MLLSGKDLLAMKQTQVRSLGWEDPLEEGMATHPVFLPGKSHEQKNLAGCNPQDCKESDTTEATKQQLQHAENILGSIQVHEKP